MTTTENTPTEAVTEFVSDAGFVAYRRNAKALGLKITQSGPVAGGYMVTTATDKRVTRAH